MYLRIDKLQIELPAAPYPDPAAAAAVQDLLGGRFGEMSTLMNYTYQSFNMRGRDAMRARPIATSSSTAGTRRWWPAR